MIARDFYLNQLISKRLSSKVKIITGLRRSGKSYFLSEIYKQYLLENGVNEDQIILVELDDEANDELLEKGKHLNNEYDALLAVPGSFKKIMVVNKPIMYYTNDMGILVISLEDFLINQKSLDL